MHEHGQVSIATQESGTRNASLAGAVEEAILEKMIFDLLSQPT